MRVSALFDSSWLMATALCFNTGCPQMLEDDFAPSAPIVAGGGSAGQGNGSGGTGSGAGSTPDECEWRRGSRCGEDADGSVLAPDSGSVAATGCGTDEIRGPNGDCYLAGSTEKTWSQARASCQARGSGWDLATIRDAEENAFALSITGFEAWIGATDATDEGVWLWVRDAAPFFDVADAVLGSPFTAWSSNEPNDADNSDCLRILTTGLWADWACDSVKGYVCQETLP